MTTSRRAALIFFVVTLGIYAFPLVYDLAYKPFFHYVAGLDVVSTSLLPVRLLQSGDFYLGEYSDFFASNWRSPYFVAEVNGAIVSRYPVAASILALPIYGGLLGTGWLTAPSQGWLFFPWTAFFAARLTATLMASIAALVFFFCARELTDLKTSLAVAIAFAFGTSVWTTSSQGLWQQTPSILLQTIALWLILRGRRLGDLAVAPAAFFFSAATIARANAAFAAIAFTGYVLIKHRSAFWRWMIWALVPIPFFLAYNSIYNGSPFILGYQEGLIAQANLLPKPDALLGLLVSPSRGLFVYSPFSFFAFLGWSRWQTARDRTLYLFSAMTIIAGILFLSLFDGWNGGWGYGTRLVVDVMPYIILLLIPWLDRANRVEWWGFGCLVVYAIILQSFGLWDGGVRWHWSWENLDADYWSFARSEPLFYLQQYVEMGLRLFKR